jgi:recombinational DNA repair ATPase RecF
LKRLVLLLGFAVTMLFASPALAGPYMNSAAMILREGFQSADFVRMNLGDRELARVAHRLALARTDAAAHLTVPKEVEKAHPHFLLAMASLERAVDSASRADISGYLRNIELARGESRTFKALLEQQRLQLPAVRECAAPSAEGGARRADLAPPSSAQPARRALRRACVRLTVDSARLAARADLPG